MAIDTDYFQRALAEKHLSQRGLAKHLGVDPSAVSLMFHGRRKMTLEEAAEVARLLNLPLDEVVARAGVHVPRAGAGAVGAGGATLMVGWIDRGGELHLDDGVWPALGGALGGRACAQLRTMGAGGPLELMDGWVASWEGDGVVGVECVGRMCLVRLVNGLMYLSALWPGYAPGRWNLRRLAGEPVINAEVSGAWRVSSIAVKNV